MWKVQSIHDDATVFVCFVTVQFMEFGDAWKWSVKKLVLQGLTLRFYFWYCYVSTVITFWMLISIWFFSPLVKDCKPKNCRTKILWKQTSILPMNIHKLKPTMSMSNFTLQEKVLQWWTVFFSFFVLATVLQKCIKFMKKVSSNVVQISRVHTEMFMSYIEQDYPTRVQFWIYYMSQI